MEIIYYDNDDHLLRLLQARNDAAMPAAVLLPRSMGWLVKAGVMPPQPLGAGTTETDISAGNIC